LRPVESSDGYVVIIWSPVLLTIAAAVAGLLIGAVVGRWWALAVTGALWCVSTSLEAAGTQHLLLFAAAFSGFLGVGLMATVLGVVLRRRVRPAQRA